MDKKIIERFNRWASIINQYPEDTHGTQQEKQMYGEMLFLIATSIHNIDENLALIRDMMAEGLK